MAFGDCEKELLREFHIYDQYVDVVSVFEALLTDVSPLRQTVRHFERYPSVHQTDGRQLTPDFTVLFDDETGLVGEIGRVARNTESLDDCCDQLLSYDGLEALPDGEGGLVAVRHVDVLFLTPFTDGVKVARRILEDCLNDPDHRYSPARSPCVVQYALEDSILNTRYVFERVPHPENGAPREDTRLADDQGRTLGIGSWLIEDNVKVSPELFERVKVGRAFMNDPIDRLYMAVHLWSQVLPTLASPDQKRPARLNVSEGQLAAELRERHGIGRTIDVRAAMELLETARLAESTSVTGDWVVAWEQPRGAADSHDLARLLAQKVCNPPRSGPIERLGTRRTEEPPPAQQLRLDT